MPNTQELLKQSQAMLDQTKAEGTKPFKGSSFDTITSDLLKGQEDMVIPPQTPPTAVDGALAANQVSAIDQAVFNQQAPTQTAEQSYITSFQDYINQQLQAPSKERITQEQYAGEVTQLGAELNRLEGQILQETNALNREIERIDANEGGRTARGIGTVQNNVKREALRNITDLRVQQYVVQGRYDSAKATADRMIDAIYADSQQDIAIRKEIMEANKDLFDKEDQRLLRLEEKQLDQQIAAEKTLQDTKLNAMQMAQINGAPQSVLEAIRTAQSPEEVIRAGGEWGNVDMLERAYRREQIATSRTNRLLALATAGDPDAIAELGFDPGQEPEQLDSTTKRQYQETANATTDLLRMATEYRDLVKKVGFTNEIFGDSKVLGRIDSLRTQMTASYKDAKKLGTLDQGLLTLMEGVLGQKPTSSILGIGPEANMFGNITGRGAKQVVSAMDELIEQTQIENARVSHALGLDPWGDPLGLGLPDDSGNTDPLGIGIMPSSTNAY